MAFVIADRVRETSTTIGTGNFTLAGAVTGYQTFDAALDTGDTTYYTIADQSGANWEVGIGTFTSPSTLARTTILSSSNGGSVVTFGAGTKDVFISLPASKTNVEDQPNLIEVNSSSAALRITQTGAGNALVVEDSANPDATPFVVDADGNVGIGTSSPNGKFGVSDGTVQIITAPFGAGLTGYFGTYTNSALAFLTNNTERARIDSNGNFMVGTTSSTVAGKNAKITAYQTTSSPAITSYVNATIASNQIIFVNPNGEVGTINTDGTTTIYGTSSDYRLKHDVQPLTNGLATIASLKPTTYKWNADNSYGEGFIAHELQAVIPQAVSGEKDAVNENGSIKPQGVDYSKIVVHLVAAIQELKAEFDAYKAAHP
jgi:hypothetical protein